MRRCTVFERVEECAELGPRIVEGVAHQRKRTLEQVAIAALISVPLGVTVAIYLNEIGGPLARPVRTVVDAMSAIPSIVAGLRISAGLGWQSLVGAELIVASSGVGYLMVKGQAAVSTATVMSGMIAVGVIGFAIDVALRRVQTVIDYLKKDGEIDGAAELARFYDRAIVPR